MSCLILVPSLLAVFFSFLSLTDAATVKYDFDVSWVWANPDGSWPRPVIGVNGQWPPPRIDANLGDTVIVDVSNSLGNQSTSLHFHGLFMNGTSHMDGTSYVSQCAISPGSSFRYKFTVKQPGTYWYHSHEKSQYPDGLRGLFLVNDPDSPFRDQYDDEIVLSLSDWYHEQMPSLLVTYDHQTGMMARDPVPKSNLINDRPEAEVLVKPGQTYLVRVINIGAFVGQYFWIRDHTMTIVEVDGVYTKPVDTHMIYVAAGQRYSFLLQTRASAGANFPIVSRMDENSFSMHSDKPKSLDAVGRLVYGGDLPLIQPITGQELNPLDDLAIEPLDEEPLLQADKSITLDIDMHTRDDGIIHWMFNNQHYTRPKLPSLFAALSLGREAADPITYGIATQTQVLDHGAVIEIVMKNKHMYPHPIHLHGHNFQVTHRSGASLNDTLPDQAPMRRDTVVVNGHGTLKLRFRADNPGVWLFHCHMEWHAHSGLMSTFVEAPIMLQQQLEGKVDHLSINPDQACRTPDEHFFKPETSEDALTLVTTPIGIGAIVGAIIVLAAALAGCLWYGRRQKAPVAAYSLVPMADAEDDPKDRRDGDS